MGPGGVQARERAWESVYAIRLAKALGLAEFSSKAEQSNNTLEVACINLLLFMDVLP